MKPCIAPASELHPDSGLTEGLGKILTEPSVVEACFSAIDGYLYPCPKEALRNVFLPL
jgi:hypothetical protein